MSLNLFLTILIFSILCRRLKYTYVYFTSGGFFLTDQGHIPVIGIEIVMPAAAVGIAPITIARRDTREVARGTGTERGRGSERKRGREIE